MLIFFLFLSWVAVYGLTLRHLEKLGFQPSWALSVLLLFLWPVHWVYYIYQVISEDMGPPDQPAT